MVTFKEFIKEDESFKYNPSRRRIFRNVSIPRLKEVVKAHPWHEMKFIIDHKSNFIHGLAGDGYHENLGGNNNPHYTAGYMKYYPRSDSYSIEPSFHYKGAHERLKEFSDHDVKITGHGRHNFGDEEDNNSLYNSLNESEKEEHIVHDISLKDLKGIAKDHGIARYVIRHDGRIDAGNANRIMHYDLADGYGDGRYKGVHTYGYVEHHSKTNEFSYSAYGQRQEGRGIFRPPDIFHPRLKEFASAGIKDYEETNHFRLLKNQRNNEKLSEAILLEGKVHSFEAIGNGYKVYENPNKDQLKTLEMDVNRSGQYDARIRSLKHKRNYYAWNANHAVHMEVADNLGIPTEEAWDRGFMKTEELRSHNYHLPTAHRENFYSPHKSERSSYDNF